MKTSRFISKSDLPAPPRGLPVTVQSLSQENVAPADQQPEMKYTVQFAELEKPFVLNITNANSIGTILNSEETDTWAGGKVEMYYDPNIMMGPKKVGGIRFRPCSGATQSADKAIDNAFDDDIPL